MTNTSIKLPIGDCDLEVRVGHDGVWLHFGHDVAIHVHNVLGQRHGIIDRNINAWCAARQYHALQQRCATDDPKTTALGAPHIEVTASDVRVCGVRVERPPAIAPSQWIAFWETKQG